MESFSDEQLDLYDAFKAASPAYVDFGTVGDQEAQDPGQATKTSEVVEGAALRCCAGLSGLAESICIRLLGWVLVTFAGNKQV